MANNAKTLWQAFTKKGMSDRDALFAIMDHFNELHWYDRNHWADKVAKLELEVAELRKANPPA